MLDHPKRREARWMRLRLRLRDFGLSCYVRCWMSIWIGGSRCICRMVLGTGGLIGRYKGGSLVDPTRRIAGIGFGFGISSKVR